MVRRTYIQLKALEEGIIGIFEVDCIGDEIEKSVIPDEFSMIGLSDEFLLYKVSASPIYSKLKSKLRELSNSSLSLLIETDQKLLLDFLVNVVKWIEDLEGSVCESSITSVKKLVIPSSFARRHADDGMQLFLELPEAIEIVLSHYNITLNIGEPKKKTLSTIVKRGSSSVHSLGAFVLRWFAFLINALRHDMILLKKWEKDVMDVLKWRCQDPKNQRLVSLTFSLKGLQRLSDLAKEAIEDLIISPEEVMLNRIECTLRQQEWIEEKELQVEHFAHNLLMNSGTYDQSSSTVSVQKDRTVSKGEYEDLLCQESIDPVRDKQITCDFADLICNESMSLI